MINLGLAVFPVLLYFSEKVTYWGHSYYLRNWKYFGHYNNTTDNIKFIELCAGPEYVFSTKMATLNCVLLSTICLGTAFPVLYVISLVAICVQYVVDRYSLATFYRLPHKQSLDLTKSNVYAICVGPLILCAVGLIMVGNAQMFGGQAIDMPLTFDDSMPTTHYDFNSSQSEVICLAAFVCVFVTLSALTLYKLARAICCPTKMIL